MAVVKEILKRIYFYGWWSEAESIFLIFLQKVLLCFASVAYSIKYSGELKKTKSKMKSKAARGTAIVFANGPSVKDVDFKKLDLFRRENDVSVFFVNSAVSSIDFFKPDYIVFADSIHFDNKEGTIYKKDMDIAVGYDVPVFIPAHYCSKVSGKKDNFYGFNGLSDIRSKNTSNILKPLGYYSMTAFYALSIACSFRFKDIYICGFDNSYFKDYEVDLDNNPVLVHEHFYDDGSKVSIAGVRMPMKSTTKYFYDFYKHFYYLEKILSLEGVEFFNLSKKTYINFCNRKHDLDIYKE